MTALTPDQVDLLAAVLRKRAAEQAPELPAEDINYLVARVIQRHQERSRRASPPCRRGEGGGEPDTRPLLTPRRRFPGRV